MHLPRATQVIDIEFQDLPIAAVARSHMADKVGACNLPNACGREGGRGRGPPRDGNIAVII